MKGFNITSLVMLLALYGCGSQEPESPTVQNVAPQVSVAKATITVDEGTTTKIDFSAVDDSTPFEQLSIELSSSENGVFAVDRVSKQIVVNAPWLSTQTTSVVSTDFSVTDKNGAKTTLRITATVNDLKSPVSVVVQPPSTGFGFEKTQTPTTLNVFLFESQNITLPYLFSDKDSDEISVSISEVTSNKYVYKNDIKLTPSSDGSGINAQIPIPDIEEPSVQFTLGVLVTDNDGQSKATVNFTIVNSVKLQWEPNAGTVISELNGASFLYETSVKPTYAATVTAVLKKTDGSIYPVSVTVDPTSHIIKIPSLPPFISDQEAILELMYASDIKNAAGEIYPAQFKLVRNVTLKDDRDDDFNTMKSLFTKQMLWLESIKQRGDDVRVSRALMNSAIIYGLIDEPSALAHMELMQKTFSTEIDNLLGRGQEIVSQLSSPSSELKVLLTKFSEDFKSVGSSVRQQTADKIKDLQLKKGFSIAWSLPMSSHELNSVKSGSLASHYVGNQTYGRFTDDKQTTWVFSPLFAYMNVANVMDSYCF